MRHVFAESLLAGADHLDRGRLSPTVAHWLQRNCLDRQRERQQSLVTSGGKHAPRTIALRSRLHETAVRTSGEALASRESPLVSSRLAGCAADQNAGADQDLLERARGRRPLRRVSGRGSR
jgi:hypothetical protein